MSNSEAIPPKRHYVFLDGLRGVAAIMVLFLHWFEGNGVELFGSALLAVDFFFILSGFVVALAYEQRLLDDRRAAGFIRQRFIRLYPMIAAGVLVGFLRFAILAYQQTGSILDPELGAQLGTGLLMIPLNPWSGVAGFFPLNNALWSLHFEFIAYFAFWLILYRLGTVKLAIIAIVAAAGCYFWARLTFGAQPVGPNVDDSATGYLHALSRVAFSFALGMIIYRMTGRLSHVSLPGGRWLAALLIAGLILPRSMVAPLAAIALMAFVFPYIIAAGTRVGPSRYLTPLEKILGDLSYPLYALHVPLIWTMSGACKTLGIGFPDRPLLNGLFILPATLLLSYAAFLLYDRPSRRWLTTRIADPTVKGSPSVRASI